MFCCLSIFKKSVVEQLKKEYLAKQVSSNEPTVEVRNGHFILIFQFGIFISLKAESEIGEII